ncbi:MAG: hypothetical protein K0S41_3755 [Anaerocolumna sp.]|nr:hypothetical protein [Anaerocolumna sp.]
MTIEEKKSIISEDYANALVEYSRQDEFNLKYANFPLNIIDERYGVIYFPVSDVSTTLQKENAYAMIPKLFGLLEVNQEALGLVKLRNIPRMDFKGEQVLLGFVDSGIDYNNTVFKYSDNTTRIVSIWDQTIENMEASEDIFNYGTEYSREVINTAIISEDPYSIVPSKDELGHGTMLAGIAGGSESEEFQGVAPLTEFVVVKLKPAKTYLRNYFGIPENATCFQEDDIMFGIMYLLKKAILLNRPIAICIGLGTSQGPHDGNLPLSTFISWHGGFNGRAFLAAAGNEGNSRHHYFGTIAGNNPNDLFELNVGADEKAFSMELWGYAPYIYSIDIQSPSGEYIPRIIARYGESREIKFLFDNTTVFVDHLIVEAVTGDPMILIRFMAPAPGLWKFKVYCSATVDVNYHVWLPITGFITENTFFPNSNPDTTITSSGNALFVTTVTAYDSATNSVYLSSSRGYTRYNVVKPNVAAPGVNIMTPRPMNQFISASGTSIATAYATGIAAILLEWGIVKGNYYSISSLQIQRFLIRGAMTDPQNIYPNNIWGYGKINIYNTFLSFRGD